MCRNYENWWNSQERNFFADAVHHIAGVEVGQATVEENQVAKTLVTQEMGEGQSCRKMQELPSQKSRNGKPPGRKTTQDGIKTILERSVDKVTSESEPIIDETQKMVAMGK